MYSYLFILLDFIYGLRNNDVFKKLNNNGIF